MTFAEKPEGNRSLVDEKQQYLGARHQANGKPGASGKARLSARQEANDKCDLPRKSLNMYTWQEIQRHSHETDQWLVINRKVYDVTGWADRHPGGRQVLNHYAGEDATDVFRAMHPDPDIVRLYLKPLLIGELAPEEPNQERNKNLVPTSWPPRPEQKSARAESGQSEVPAAPAVVLQLSVEQVTQAGERQWPRRQRRCRQLGSASEAPGARGSPHSQPVTTRVAPDGQREQLACLVARGAAGGEVQGSGLGLSGDE
ncbi:unnamed protein product [Rangifer tarandus platyrhynchus]|uniref:Cytochrome b5 heme-binding domain-containing protein n=1 Tax=Rangifer tarandus platyrhynchus TaxID=3082113 RepID=A0ABN8XZJ3_RANTA|nr:unnamed protein product [Rangifer tarandus platyrhynchus]